MMADKLREQLIDIIWDWYGDNKEPVLADRILNLFKSQIEDAKKAERERIMGYIETYGLSAAYIARPDIECIGISKFELQALKEQE